MGKNFLQKERKSCLDKETGISGKRGKRQATLQVSCGCSTAILYSTLEASVRAEQSWRRRKESGKQQAFPGTQSTGRPPPTDVGQTKLSRPAQYQHYRQEQGHYSFKQTLFLSSQKSPGNRALKSQRHKGAPHLECHRDRYHTNSHHGDTGTPKLNITGPIRPHKYRYHGDRHSHDRKVIGTPHTHTSWGHSDKFTRTFTNITTHTHHRETVINLTVKASHISIQGSANIINKHTHQGSHRFTTAVKEPHTCKQCHTRLS